jgi:hypothetical protein
LKTLTEDGHAKDADAADDAEEQIVDVTETESETRAPGA